MRHLCQPQTEHEQPLARPPRHTLTNYTRQHLRTEWHYSYSRLAWCRRGRLPCLAVFYYTASAIFKLARFNEPAWSKGSIEYLFNSDQCSWLTCGGYATYEVANSQSALDDYGHWRRQIGKLPFRYASVSIRGGSLAAGAATGVWDSDVFDGSASDIAIRGSSRLALAALALKVKIATYR